MTNLDVDQFLLGEELVPSQLLHPSLHVSFLSDMYTSSSTFSAKPRASTGDLLSSPPPAGRGPAQPTPEDLVGQGTQLNLPLWLALPLHASSQRSKRFRKKWKKRRQRGVTGPDDDIDLFVSGLSSAGEDMEEGGDVVRMPLLSKVPLAKITGLPDMFDKERLDNIRMTRFSLEDSQYKLENLRDLSPYFFDVCVALVCTMEDLEDEEIDRMAEYDAKREDSDSESDEDSDEAEGLAELREELKSCMQSCLAAFSRRYNTWLLKAFSPVPGDDDAKSSMTQLTNVELELFKRARKAAKMVDNWERNRVADDETEVARIQDFRGDPLGPQAPEAGAADGPAPGTWEAEVAAAQKSTQGAREGQPEEDEMDVEGAGAGAGARTTGTKRRREPRKKKRKSRAGFFAPGEDFVMDAEAQLEMEGGRVLDDDGDVSMSDVDETPTTPRPRPGPRATGDVDVDVPVPVPVPVLVDGGAEAGGPAAGAESEGEEDEGEPPRKRQKLD